VMADCNHLANLGSTAHPSRSPDALGWAVSCLVELLGGQPHLGGLSAVILKDRQHNSALPHVSDLSPLK
jgi:hypothetical protein